MRIAICHQTFAAGDAIGNDILGMCRVLRACGHEPYVLCEFNPHKIDHCEISHDFSDEAIRKTDLFIYHHSQNWSAGQSVVERAGSPIAFKFHNITPEHFFSPYSATHAERCRQGIDLTAFFINLQKPHVWLCDSLYNREVLLNMGAAPALCHVVPPFNNAHSFLQSCNDAEATDNPIHFLFVGRFAPNKGHLALLEFCAAYRRLFDHNFQLLVVGALDRALDKYWHKFAAQARAMDLSQQLRVYAHLPDAIVHKLFKTAHVYLTFSEHEGFCVPMLEAQAVGLPVVGSEATAIRETAGSGQFIGRTPVTTNDFEFYATLANTAIREKPVRQTLVNQGRRNVLTRFVDDVVENAFLVPLLPWLQRQ